MLKLLSSAGYQLNTAVLHALEISAGMPLEVIACVVVLSCRLLCLQRPLQVLEEAAVRLPLSVTRCADMLCLGPHAHALCIAGASTAVAEAEAIASSTGRKLLEVA